MNLKNLISTLLYGSLIGLLGCTAPASKPKVIEATMDPSPANKPKSGLFITYQLITDDPVIASDGCRLFLTQTDGPSGKAAPEFEVLLKKDQNSALVEMGPGTYLVDRLFCYKIKYWSFHFTNQTGFKIKDGFISWLGPLHFKIEDRKDLKDVRGIDPKGLSDWETRYSSLGLPLISGYSDVPISSAMIQAAMKSHFKVSTPDPGYQRCLKKEGITYYIPLGNYRIRRTAASAGRPLEVLEDTTTASSVYKDCVRHRLQTGSSMDQKDVFIGWEAPSK